MKNINEKYDISTKATSIINTTGTHSLIRTHSLMLTHSLTQSLIVVASKVKEFDENYKVSEKFNEKFTQFYTFAVQIDEKYAITPTAGRIITASTEVTYTLTHSLICLLTHLLTHSFAYSLM